MEKERAKIRMAEFIKYSCSSAESCEYCGRDLCDKIFGEKAPCYLEITEIMNAFEEDE